MKVAIGLITNQRGDILITRRPFDVPEGGKWEFPGGKIHSHESPVYALVRELQEELDIFIDIAHYRMRIRSAPLDLFVYDVPSFKGVPRCCAGQLDICWVKPFLLHTFCFPEPNKPIIDALCATL